MIIKSKSIKDMRGIRRTVEYVFREDKSATLLHTRLLPRTVDTETIIKQMEKVEDRRLRRRKDSVILFHDIISFHSGDSHKLQDDVFLKKVARKYSLMRDQSTTICVLHREQKHVHIHILAGCRLDGRSARVSKAEFAKKKLELERFQQQELRLVYSRVHHEKSAPTLTLKHSTQEIKRNGRIPEKEVLARRVAELLPVSNIQELKKVLEQNGIQIYERNGILTGVCNDKKTRKYRLRNLGIDTLDLNHLLHKEKERVRRLKQTINRNKNKER